MVLVTMGLLFGDKLTIRAEGCDALEVVTKLKSLIESKFGEGSDEPIGTGYDVKFDESLIKIPQFGT